MSRTLMGGSEMRNGDVGALGSATRRRSMSGLAIIVATGAACSGGTGPGTGQQITLSVAAAAAGASATAVDSVTIGGHTLVLEQVELVLREIELERLFDACDRSDSSGSSSRSDDDDCEELSVGPMLLDLPLGGAPERVVTIEADSGIYREVEFEIHKPEDDEGDDQFLREHPDFRKVSIRARGRYDGQAFVFQTDLSAKQEYDLVPPLVVSERTATNLTLVVSVADWFRVRGALVDPMQALKGGAFEGDVKDNIKRSFEVFEDRDHDGRSDHD